MKLESTPSTLRPLHCTTGFIFTILPPGYISSPALCHNLVCSGFDYLSLPQGIILVHCIDDTILTGPGDQEVATALGLLIRRLCIRRWDISDKNSGDFYLREMSRGSAVWGHSLSGEGCNASSPSLNHRRGTMSSGPLWVWEATFSSFGV